MSLADAKKRFPEMPEIEYLPMGKNVLVYRIPGEEKTAGGLFVPDANREVKSRGILLAAGLAARDILADNLIEIGDEVCGARWGWEDRDTKRKEGAAVSTIAECKVEDILGSVDALRRAESYEVVRDEKTGEHNYLKRKGRAA